MTKGTSQRRNAISIKLGRKKNDSHQGMFSDLSARDFLGGYRENEGIRCLNYKRKNRATLRIMQH